MRTVLVVLALLVTLPAAAPAPVDLPAPPHADVAPGVVARVALEGRSPYGLDLDPITRRAFVGTSGTLDVVDLTTHTLVASIEVGGPTWGVAFDPLTERIFVARTSPPAIVVVSGLALTVEAEWPMPFRPSALGLFPTAGRLVVGNADGRPGETTVLTLDTSSGETVGTLAASGAYRVYGIAAEPVLQRAYVLAGPMLAVDVLTTEERWRTGYGFPGFAVGVDSASQLVYVGRIHIGWGWVETFTSYGARRPAFDTDDWPVTILTDPVRDRVHVGGAFGRLETFVASAPRAPLSSVDVGASTGVGRADVLTGLVYVTDPRAAELVAVRSA